MPELSQFIDSLPIELGERAEIWANGACDGSFVMYWMRTAVRADENPALEAAIALENELGLPVFVYHALSENYPFASDRHHTFILQGARDVQSQLAEREIGYAFHLERERHRGPHLKTLADQAALVVTEDMPVQPLVRWMDRLRNATATPILMVDTACILPMRLVGQAYTRAFKFRDATKKARAQRLTNRLEPVSLKHNSFVPDLPFEPVNLARVDLAELVAECQIDHSIAAVPHTVGGSTAGYARWDAFRENGLKRYAKTRNNALIDGVSRMSAYLHFGMVSPMRIAREAHERGGESAEKYLDELLIWRELAYAFCKYRPDHEELTAVPDWAIETLKTHESDSRETIPSHETLTRGHTGDQLWDAAQRSLLIHGELHNNVRMTWGKAFLSWTRNASEALRLMIDLNHRYALDGRDPASYGGLLWCLGQFDRPFEPQQPILGAVRPRPTSEHAKRLDPQKYFRRCTRPLANPMPTIAIVGAGLSGVTCGRILSDHGFAVTIFEKSRGAGGRMSTRRKDNLRFDHGAQYFTARDARFVQQVESWIHDGHVELWDGRIAVIGRSSEIEWAESGTDRYVATPRMNSLCKHLADELNVVTETRVEVLTPAETEKPKWALVSDEGMALGEFDGVIVSAPAGQSAELLKPVPSLAKQAASCQMNPCWATMLAFPSALKTDFDAAFVHNSGIAWIARNNSKPHRPETESWVVHASSDWTLDRMDMPREQVADTLLNEFRSLTGLEDIPLPEYSTAHFWRYAIPPEPLGARCLFDPERAIAACGDWCGGPRVEGAYLSGVAAAGRMMGHFTAQWEGTAATIGDSQRQLF